MTDTTTTKAPVTPADRRRARKVAPMTRHAAASHADWSFEVRADQPLTAATLADAGLPPVPLADVRLDLAQIASAGRWHLAPATTAACCPRLARATERGRTVRTASIGLLDGTRLCRWCARHLTIPGLVVPGPEGGYLAIVQYLIATRGWITALEAQAPTADWLTCSQWTARTPFTDPCPIPGLLAALPGDSPWTDYAAAAEAAWEQLRERGTAAHEQARQAAGPPGYRAMAACARAIVGASPGTRLESRLLDGSAGLPISAGAWTIASTVWLNALATDADLRSAEAALTTAIERRYADVQVRDVTLLPSPAATDPEQFDSPADWAQAEHDALRHQITRLWCDKLTDCLASVLSQDLDSDWQLLRIAGWPATSELDRDLAYLAAYPELARMPDPDCGYPCGRGHPAWVVILHVPCFAVIHATLHDGLHLDITPGPALPVHATPTAAQLRSLLHDDPDPCPASPVDRRVL